MKKKKRKTSDSTSKIREKNGSLNIVENIETLVKEKWGRGRMLTGIKKNWKNENEELKLGEAGNSRFYSKNKKKKRKLTVENKEACRQRGNQRIHMKEI